MQDHPPIDTTEIDSHRAAWMPAIEPLAQTRPWVKFLAILGFISCGLMLLVGTIMFVAGLASGRPEALLGLLYAGFAVLYFFPARFLFDYGTQISVFERSPSVETLAEALTRQKSFWKFVGILMIVVLCVYALMFVIMIMAAMAGGMH